MFVRLALESDTARLCELGEAHAAEIWPGKVWSKERAQATMRRYLETANPTIYVVEDKRTVVGYGVFLLTECSFTTSTSAFLDVIYVEPVKRGTRAAVLLMQAFEDWSRRAAPDEICIQAIEPTSPAHLERFFRRYGFVPAGVNYRRAQEGTHESTKR